MINPAKLKRWRAAKMGAAVSQKTPVSLLSATNLGQYVPYGPVFPFKNFFLGGEKWLSQNDKPFGSPHDDTGNPIVVDANGFPVSFGPATESPYTQIAAALFCNEAPTAGSYPQGQQWVLLWEGDPDANFAFWGNIASTTPNDLGHYPGTPAGPNRITVNVGTTNGQLRVILREFDPLNPITKIAFLPTIFEDNYEDDPFYPPYVQMLKGYGILRFMDWQMTNNSNIVQMSDARSAASCFQSGRPGVALEYQVALANKCNARPWFCIPHQASDAYITALATYVRDNLKTTLKPLFEFSNEIWNGIFQQEAYAIAQSIALGLHTGNNYIGLLRWQSRRHVQAMRLIETVYGGTTRFERVMSGQNIGAFPTETLLDWETDGEPASDYTDLYANAPYFGSPLGDTGTWNSTTQFMTVDDVLDWCEAYIDDDDSWDTLRASRDAALARGVRYTTYEGGQHLGGNTFALQSNPAVGALFIAANRSPRMGTVYGKMLARLKAEKVEVLVHYYDLGLAGASFQWGARENAATATPKDQAIRKFHKF